MLIIDNLYAALQCTHSLEEDIYLLTCTIVQDYNEHLRDQVEH